MTTAPAEPLGRLHGLLSRAGRLPGSRAGSSLLAFLDQAIFSGANFAATLLIANYATREQLGVWQMAMTLALLGYFLQEALVLAPYRVKYYALAAEERPAYFGSALIHSGVLLVAAPIVLLAAVVVVHLAAPEIAYEGVFAALAIALPFVLARDAARRLALIHFENAKAALIDVACTVVLLSGLVLAFETGFVDLRLATVILGIATGGAALLWWRLQGVPYSLATADWRKDWRENWTIGRWILASMLVSNGATLLLMPWALAFAKGEAVAGEFAAAASVAGLASLFVNGFGNFLGPYFAKVHAQEGRKAFARSVVLPSIGFAVGLGGAALGATFFAEPLASLLYSGKYSGIGPAIALLFWHGLMLGMGIIAATGLYAMHRPRANFVADLVNLIAAVVAMTFLIEPFGATGAAASYLIGTVCGSSTRWIAFLIALLSPNEGAEESAP